MKKLIFVVVLVLTSTLGFSQNILEALALKDALIGEYVEGEASSTDTIIDLNNGYYEEFSSSEGGSKTVIRQAAIFRNHDGSTTLGVSIASWDFQCYVYESNFYDIAKSGDSIHIVANADILPELSIREFIAGSKVLPVLNKYLPTIQKDYLSPTATSDEVLSEIYHIVYRLPQTGTSLLATLKICDYIPTNEVSIHPSDWAIIENVSRSIELEYDKTQKTFKRR